MVAKWMFYIREILVKKNNCNMKIQTALIILIMLLATFSCKDDCKPNSVGSAEKLSKLGLSALFPYKGDEKLKFLKNGIDTVLFNSIGFVDGYNYITSQTDCPYQIPLQYKSMTFIDSISSNKFQLINYRNSYYGNDFILKLNNQNVFNDAYISFLLLDPPYKSVTINNRKYDTLTYVENNNNYAYYKTFTTGMVKFKIDNDVFELLQ
jgi:hypothetical protein